MFQIFMKQVDNLFERIFKYVGFATKNRAEYGLNGGKEFTIESIRKPGCILAIAMFAKRINIISFPVQKQAKKLPICHACKVRHPQWRYI